MNFVFGYAGIPLEAFDGVVAREKHIRGEDRAIFGDPLKWATYPKTYANVLQERFAKLIKDDHHNALYDTAFAVIFIDYHDAATSGLVESLFPAMLCAAVEWQLDSSSPSAVRRSKNQLLEALKTMTNRARRALVALSSEISDKPGYTPLLLPVRNFSSDRLAPTLRELQTDLVRTRDEHAPVRAAAEDLAQRHPGVLNPRRAFVDDRNIQFKPPGSVRGRHGFIHPNAGHPPACLLSGRRRLGAPYDKQFHYDCIRGDGPLDANLFSCHWGPERMIGDPHLNIAPNDFVRR